MHVREVGVGFETDSGPKLLFGRGISETRAGRGSRTLLLRGMDEHSADGGVVGRRPGR
jgi:hypothetical protein